MSVTSWEELGQKRHGSPGEIGLLNVFRLENRSSVRWPWSKGQSSRTHNMEAQLILFRSTQMTETAPRLESEMEGVLRVAE